VRFEILKTVAMKITTFWYVHKELQTSENVKEKILDCQMRRE
jgi:hypothetical protein